MATSVLGPDGTVAIDGLVLSAPGVRGEVSVERVARPGRVPAGGAAAGTAPDPLDRALRRQGMRTYQPSPSRDRDPLWPRPRPDRPVVAPIGDRDRSR
jgi:hypothetical protein